MISFFCGFIYQNIRKDLLVHFSISKFKLFSSIDTNLDNDYLFLTKYLFQKLSTFWNLHFFQLKSGEIWEKFLSGYFGGDNRT